MNDSSIPAYRVWKLTACAMLDRVVLSVHTYTVKVERQGDTFTAAYCDGQPVSIEQAAHLLTWAKATGTLEQVEAFDPAPALTLGRPRASQLHRTLARLGLGHADHYRAASAALGRPVDSLAALTEGEGRRVWNHARAVRLAYQQAA